MTWKVTAKHVLWCYNNLISGKSAFRNKKEKNFRSGSQISFSHRSMMTMKSMKYQECDTIMDNYNPVPPPLPRRVPPVRNIYAEPFETNTSRWVKSFRFDKITGGNHCEPIIIILNSTKFDSTLSQLKHCYMPRLTLNSGGSDFPSCSFPFDLIFRMNVDSKLIPLR